MECLHGEAASSSKTTNCIFFYCGQQPSCNFFCQQVDCSYFHNAIVLWRNSNILHPKCHEHKKLTKMRVVKDIFKPSFGRPFFVCSDKENPCSFWQWGDVIRPHCYHGIQCSTRKVKKESANHGRLFYCGRAVILSGMIKKKTKIRSKHFPLCILAILLRMVIRSRKPAKSSQVVMKI